MFSFTLLGSYHINVTAYNLINNLTITNEIVVDALITLHEIEISGDVYDGVPVRIIVRLIGGLDVNATLFSNGFIQKSTWIIQDATVEHLTFINAT